MTVLVYNGPPIQLRDEQGQPVTLQNGDAIELVKVETMRLYGARLIPASRWRRFLRRLALRTL